MARHAETRWDMLNVAFENFQTYIGGKRNPCSLSFVDLLYVSNFKGGNASITEPLDTLRKKLPPYESALEVFQATFGNSSLKDLEPTRMDSLLDKCYEFLCLAKDEKTKIRGFGPSYASALLAAHFPDLVPVLDKWALNGAGVKVKYDSQKQVKDIANYYRELIKAFKCELNKSQLTLRQQDKIWFSRRPKSKTSD